MHQPRLESNATGFVIHLLVSLAHETVRALNFVLVVEPVMREQH